MKFRLLHLSDLHLGNDIVLRSLRNGRSWRRKADPLITTGLTEAIRELNPDYVIISGDLVNKPDPGMFREAAVTLRTIFANAGYDLRSKVLIVPGNHDVSFLPKKHTDDWKRLAPYRTFLRDLYAE